MHNFYYVKTYFGIFLKIQHIKFHVYVLNKKFTPFIFHLGLFEYLKIVRMIGRRPGGALGLGVVLLASEVFRTGVSNIPPVTLGFLALNSAIYMRLIRIVRHVGEACVSYNHIWKLKQWRRILLASFFHLDDMHLYFNMISFLWKGRTLERRYGSRKFFIIIIVFAVLSQILLTILNRLLATMLWNSSYLTSCAAGFSAVIFALKVLTTNNMWEESVSILGLPVTVPAQLACWVELVLIQILVPNASFAGHLAGILVGFAFIYGPLEKIINKVDQFIGRTQGKELLLYRPNWRSL